MFAYYAWIARFIAPAFLVYQVVCFIGERHNKRMHTCTQAYKHINMHACMHTYIYTCIHICIHAYVRPAPPNGIILVS